ncbi:hypothetical protein KQ945_06855 [Bacillus subtilis subsp. subtilis]|nr:hypothetical protein [Bacillus subtilis subsp. subtilis]
MMKSSVHYLACWRSTTLLVAVCLPCVACHPQGRIVEGTFTVNGKARAGVEVHLAGGVDDAACGNGRPAAVTDAAGRFRGIARDYPIIPCFTVDGRNYSTFLIVDDHKQTPIRLTCGLPLNITAHFEDGHICW